ncbi:General alpha-glucoside permease [Penicillium oxalicum]|uniref:General alpha-glucoside permease n=1 Tax=Penicillium oxalicum TaxID=69781 RepID=UPI0020B778D9|nr:General alpha-glucoside permease [Penicillium oxalicum]KAI2787867.1 General alpha-glucoside permease [Penicillium oxalicum]
MSVAVVDDDGAIRGIDTGHVRPEAKRATEAEHKMSFRQSLRTYPHAVGWSVLFSTALVMEGYDNALIATLFAYGPFQRTFGNRLADGSYQITAAWQSGLTNGALVGEILGLFATGIVVERFGYRKSLIGALMACVAFIFIIFFAKSLPVLLVGEILIGIPWGLFQTVTTTYASEVCPVVLRPYLTTYVNLCWVMGQFIASGVLKAMQDRDDQWGYKIPFALQWMWPIPIAIGIALAPESPWWLIRKERPEDARHALHRLTVPGRDPNFNADETIAMIRSTNELEKRLTAGTSYLDCFWGVDRRRTEVVCLTWATQMVSGSSLMGYSTYFYEQAGMAPSNAFTMTMVLYILGALGTLSSWPLMTRFGRRTLYVGGLACMGILLLIIGFLGIISRENVAAQWAVGSLLLIYAFTYDATVGPICYSLVSELSSTRLRTKTIVLARNLYNVCGLITNIITPRMLNPSAWDWGAKAGFFWAGICLICFTWTYFRLPEPQGRTYAELDLLFEQQVPARKFSSTRVDPFASDRASSVGTKSEMPITETVEKIDL